MKCEEFLALLGDYLDEDLDREVYQAFRTHVACCPKCEVVVDNVYQTITLYKSGQPVQLPAELQKGLRRALQARWKTAFPPDES